MCDKVLIKSAYPMHRTSKKEGNSSKHLLFLKITYNSLLKSVGKKSELLDQILERLTK